MASRSLPVCQEFLSFIEVDYFVNMLKWLDLNILYLSTSSVSVRIFRLYFVGTRLMWRTGKWKRSRSHSIGRRICSTMRYLQRVTTILKSHISILLENLQGKVTINWCSCLVSFRCKSVYTNIKMICGCAGIPTCTLWSLQHSLHQKYILT